MALANLFQLLQSDDQQTFTDKTNANFDLLISMNGGGPGPQGVPGKQGIPGMQGTIGSQGLPGKDGTYLFVLPSTTPPSVPTPKVNDVWIQTDTSLIMRYIGSPLSWVQVGALSITGVFSQGGTNNLVFTQPNSTRSLVLSPINYGISTDSPGTANYRLKIVSSSGNAAIKFAVNDAGTENNEIYQPSIDIQKISGTSWTWNFNNNYGDVKYNLNGNYFGILAQVGSSSIFEFNSQVKLTLDPSNRVLSFSGTNSGTEFFHIGRHGANTNPADRIISIGNDGLIGIGDAFDNLISGETYPVGYLVDQYHPQLVSTPAEMPWHRWRSKIDSTTSHELRIHSIRDFNDVSGPTTRSASIKLFHSSNNNIYHGISFHGGAKDSSLSLRPQMRFSYGGSFYFAADLNGRIGIGDNQFIKDYNNNAGFNFPTNLNIKSAGSVLTGSSAYGGLHYIHSNTGNVISGMTAGGPGTYSTLSNAGVMFQSDAAGIETVILTSKFTYGGQRVRYRTAMDGNHYFYDRNSASKYIIMELGGQSVGSTEYVNPLMIIRAQDDSTGAPRNITFNPTTNAAGVGSGFIGFGKRFGPIIGAGMVTGQWYVAVGTVTHNSITYSDGIIFQAAGPSFSGQVALAHPQTKVHIDGALTLGYRQTVTNFSNDIGIGSITAGNNLKASGIYSGILGGEGHTTNGNYTYVIGYTSGSNVTVNDSNKIVMAASTCFTGGTTPYFTSSNPQHANQNMVSIDMVGNYNGLEVQIDTATTAKDPMLVTSYSSSPPVARSTTFLVNRVGQTVLGGDMVSTTDPGTNTSNITWSTQTPRLLIKNNPNIILDTVAPTTSSPTNNVFIQTTNKTGDNANRIFGAHLSISGGIIRNIDLTSGTATGGNLYLSGGRGENCSVFAGPETKDTYGNVVLGYDLAKNEGGNGVVTAYGNVQLIEQVDPHGLTSVSNFVSNYGDVSLLTGDPTITRMRITSFLNSNRDIAGFSWDSKPFDRVVYYFGTGTGTNGPKVAWEFFLDSPGGMLFTRMVGDPFSGGSIIIPANRTIHVKVIMVDASGGSVGPNFDWVFRQLKLGR